MNVGSVVEHMGNAALSVLWRQIVPGTGSGKVQGKLEGDTAVLRWLIPGTGIVLLPDQLLLRRIRPV